jgi:hypothetical protein
MNVRTPWVFGVGQIEEPVRDILTTGRPAQMFNSADDMAEGIALDLR